MTPPPLRGLRVAHPCAADWAAMPGTDRVRTCADCALHVYNLSELTAPEARALIRQHDGRLCVRLYRRADGTVLTRDCPEAEAGAAGERRRGALVALGLAALFAGSVGMTQAAWSFVKASIAPSVYTEVMGDLAVPEDGWLDGDLLMGEVSVEELPYELEMGMPPPPPAPPPPPPPPPRF